MEIYTDASKTGWGANIDNTRTHGFWDRDEKKRHINYLELVAAYNELWSFAKDITNSNILLCIDNVTAIACINRIKSLKNYGTGVKKETILFSHPTLNPDLIK